jgi:hypothetical protein
VRLYASLIRHKPSPISQAGSRTAYYGTKKLLFKDVAFYGTIRACLHASSHNEKSAPQKADSNGCPVSVTPALRTAPRLAPCSARGLATILLRICGAILNSIQSRLRRDNIEHHLLRRCAALACFYRRAELLAFAVGRGNDVSQKHLYSRDVADRTSRTH